MCFGRWFLLTVFICAVQVHLRAQDNTIKTPAQNSVINQGALNTVQQFNPYQNSTIQQSNTLYPKGDFNLKAGSKLLDSALYYSEKAPSKAVAFINQAIARSISEQDRYTEATAYLVLGNIQRRLQQHDAAIGNYLKCIQVAQTKVRENNPSSLQQIQETLFQANKQLATAYIELNDLEKAENRINSAFGYTSVNDAEWLVGRRLLALIRQKQNRSPESLVILNDVLAREQQAHHVVGETDTYLAIGNLYLEDENDDKAIDYFTRAKTLAERKSLPEQALEANDGLAKIFRKQKNLAKEVEARNSKININASANNPQGIVSENIQIGNAYLNANQLETAQRYFDKGIGELNAEESNGEMLGQQQQTVFFPKSSGLDEAANTYKVLAEQYLKQRDPARALLYFDKYAALQDSIKHVRQRELNEALSLSTNLGKNQQKVELLEKERLLYGRSMELLRQDKVLKEEQLGFKNGIIGVLVLFIFSMLTAGFFVMRSAREKRKANQQLALRSLRGQMNPHFIFNALNSVNHYISQNDERKANRYLSDFSKLMRMVMDSSRHTVVSLADELDMLRLYLQLEHTRFKDKFDYTFETDENLSNSDFELPPMLIQPYLENAIWHGLRYLDEKGMLSLKIENAHGGLMVSVTDNGIGRTKSKALKTSNQKKQTSIGMQNIENRIVIMNDLFSTNIRVEVEDAFPDVENCGTRVKIYIPQQTTS